MSTPNLIITQLDRQRLEHMLSTAFAQVIGPDAHLEQFRAALQHATIVAAKDVPEDIVTMNSTIALYDIDFDVTESYTLVYPVDADIFSNRLSILNPMGTAILGRRPGAIIRWENCNGVHQLELKELSFQPEREGVLTL